MPVSRSAMAFVYEGTSEDYLYKSLSRRRFLATGAGAISAVPLASASLALAAPACILTPEQEVGPFYIGGEKFRSRIAEDRQGVPLRLRLVVLDSRTCAPLHNAAIDLWHCDAMGLYSGFMKTKLGPPPGEGDGPGGPPPDGFGGPPPLGGERPGGVEGHGEGPHGGPPPAMKPSDQLTFLRGIQMTDAEGAVVFETVFPGFYSGRTNHIHFKVRLEGHREGKTYVAGHTSHVGQVFFPEDWNLKLMAQAPYAEHRIHRTTEAEDGIFTRQHGSMAVATLIPVDAGKPAAGLVAELRVAVDPTATPKPVEAAGFGGPRPKS